MNKATKLDELVGSVEALLAQLPASVDPAMTALRDRVDDGIFDAWTSISNERMRKQRYAQAALPSTAVLLGLTALVAIATCVISARAARI